MSAAFIKEEKFFLEARCLSPCFLLLLFRPPFHCVYSQMELLFIRTQEAETYLKIRQVKTKLVSQFLFPMCLFLPQTPIRHDSVVTKQETQSRHTSWG